jgi:alpha-L-fucosidase
MMDGRMEQRQVERLQQMGSWLKKYGESIYGTNGGPYAPNANYSATRKGNNVYVHLFDTDKTTISLPVLPGAKIVRASLMNGTAVQLTTSGDQYHISLPARLPDTISNVLILQLDKSAMEIPVIGKAQ